MQRQFYDSVNFKMKKGDKKKITLLLDGKKYDAVLTNIFFDEKNIQPTKIFYKYDILQIVQ